MRIHDLRVGQDFSILPQITVFKTIVFDLKR